jgi:hypothetical protein
MSDDGNVAPLHTSPLMREGGAGDVPPPPPPSSSREEYAARRARVRRIYQETQECMIKHSNTLTDEVQTELGAWINIISAVVPEISDYQTDTHTTPWKNFKGRFFTRHPVDPEDILDRAELAVTLLSQESASSLRFSRELRYEIRNDLSWNGGPFQRAMIRMTGGSSGMAVVWGAAVTTVIGIPLLLCIFSETILSTTSAFLQLHQKIIVGTAIPAFLGAVVSILTRLQDFDSNRSADLKLLFLTAFFKPYIGMITGLFIVSALAIGIGGVQDAPLFTPEKGAWPTQKVYYFLYVVGFLAGFSERLASDFVAMAEDRFTGRSRPGGSAGGGG